MTRERPLQLASALLATISIGAAAAAIESASIDGPYDVPAREPEGSGISLLEVLFSLAIALLEVVGIELDPVSPAAGGISLGSLFAWLLPLVPYVLGLAAIATIVGASYLAARRLPDEVTAAVTTRLPWWNTHAAGGPGGDPTVETWPPCKPENAVASTWLEMTAALEIDRPRARTPGEWRTAAAAAGCDEEAVTELTRTFEAVRYGGARPSPDRRRRAKRALETIAADLE